MNEPTAARSTRTCETTAPTDHADHQRHREPDGGSTQRGGHGRLERPARGLLAQRLEHLLRRREHELGSPAARHHRLPDREADADGGQLRPGRRPDPARQRRPPGASPARGRRGPPALDRDGRRLVAAPSRSDVGMASHLRTQLVGDLRGQGRTPRASPCAEAARCRRANSLTTRPGRLDSSTTRSASRAASRTLWVTKTTLRLRSAHRRSSSAWRRSRVMASRAPKGSSISRMSASWAKARAIATRWRMPPDSSWGRLSPKPSRWTVWSSWSASAARRFRGTPRSRRARAMLARTVSHGNSAASWNIRATRPRRSMRAGRGRVEAGDQVEERALAAARGADEAEQLAGLDLEGDAVQGVHRRRPLPVHLREVADLQRRQRGRRDGRGHRRDRHRPSTSASPRSARTSLRSLRS